MSKVTAKKILLSVGGHVRVRVRGKAWGWLSCSGERRFVWGRFDESFRLAVGGGPTLSLLGVGSLEPRALHLDASHELRPPAPRRKEQFAALCPTLHLPRLLAASAPRTRLSVGRARVRAPSFLGAVSEEQSPSRSRAEGAAALGATTP